MTTSIAEAILQGAHKLRQANVPEARREAGSLLAYVLNRDSSFILSHAGDTIDVGQAERFGQCLERRAQGEPLQYISGHQEFFGLDFEVTRDVLIPRPETELLTETGLKLFVGVGDASICDVGTGSGCIAITLLHKLPQAHAIALDFSPGALAVAQRNAARHSVADRIKFVIASHNKSRFCGDCTEFADDELDLGKIVVVEHIVFFKLLRTISAVIEVGVVANGNVAGFDKMF